MIPGHGGVVDRMDCQIMMGMFVYVYINSFVLTAAEADADEVVRQLNSLKGEEQLHIYKLLGRSLRKNGFI